ncbi:MAG: Crp/Fnr family transcriptional regulator [Rhodobacter sp.]|jgi:CRP-like cAMP-binding protein|nr:Crp/Fnr family transcriptional regulator [Rhodobacter sp.]
MKNSVRFPHLNRAPVLRKLPEAFKTHFLDSCTVRTYEQSEPILTQGDTVHGMFMIAHGSVEITSINPEGQTVLIHLCRQGEVFGDIEALSDNPAAANCAAAGQTVILFSTKSLLIESTKTPMFLRNIMHVSYERLVRDNQIKFVDQFYPVEQRLCDYLYRLSADKPEVSKTQADLAGLLGCARQTLNRELGRLRDREIIAMEKGKIAVRNRAALRVQAHSTDPAERNRVS